MAPRKAALLLFSIAAWAAAQTPRPAFDVVSVKQNKSGDKAFRMNLGQPGGRFIATNVPLDYLIAQAFPLPASLLSQAQLRMLRYGWPSWMSDVHFDINAVVEGSPSRAQKVLMLQSLLADRFKLAVHHEDQQHPVYALVPVRPGKLGPQLRPHTDECLDVDVFNAPPGTLNLTPKNPGDPLPTPPCAGFTLAPGRLAGKKVTLTMLGSFIAAEVNLWVIDRSGLDGTFDLTLQYTPQPVQPDPNAATADDSTGPPSIFTAVRDQLGLKFEKQIGPVPVLVIDHVEMPSEN